MEKQVNMIVEKHADGYVAYPLGLKGMIVDQGDTYMAALETCAPLSYSTFRRSGTSRYRTNHPSSRNRLQKRVTGHGCLERS